MKTIIGILTFSGFVLLALSSLLHIGIDGIVFMMLGML